MHMQCPSASAACIVWGAVRRIYIVCHMLLYIYTLSRTVLALARQKFISQHLYRAPGTSLVSNDAAESVDYLTSVCWIPIIHESLDLDIK